MTGFRVRLGVGLSDPGLNAMLTELTDARWVIATVFTLLTLLLIPIAKVQAFLRHPKTVAAAQNRTTIV